MHNKKFTLSLQQTGLFSPTITLVCYFFKDLLQLYKEAVICRLQLVVKGTINTKLVDDL